MFNALLAIVRESETSANAQAASQARTTLYQAAIRQAYADDDGFPMHGDGFGNLELVQADCSKAADELRTTFATAIAEATGYVLVLGYCFELELDSKGGYKPASKHKPVRRLADVASLLQRGIKAGSDASAASFIESTDTGFKVRPENKAAIGLAEAEQAARLDAMSPVRRLIAEAELLQAEAEAANAEAAEAEAEAASKRKAAEAKQAEALAKLAQVEVIEAASLRVVEAEAKAKAEAERLTAEAEAANGKAKQAEAERKAEAKARKTAQAARAEAEAALLAAEAKAAQA